MNYLIGIDDTDNKDSRGTGFRSRKMAELIEENNLGRVLGITRHQLFVHPDIAYTSQNSSACLEIESLKPEKLRIFCRDFLFEDSAPGSDAGISFCQYEKIDQEILDWGERAKKVVLKMDDAFALAEKHSIYLEGLTGERIGVIGALAAIGLRKGGNDGRFIWVAGNRLREITGIKTTDELNKEIGLGAALDMEGNTVPSHHRIKLHDWLRPCLKNNQKIIYVNKNENNENHRWEMASKEYHKQRSS